MTAIRHLQLLLAVAATVGVLGVGACLDALPPAVVCEAPSRVIDGVCVACAAPLVFVGDDCVECPPPAQVPNRSCFDTVNNLPQDADGCIGEIADGFGCVAGDPPDCACDPDDCTETLSCFGDGSCPPDVVASAPNATCLPLTESEWSYFAYPFADANHDTTDCVCNCIRCAAQCDGKGTAFGVFEDGAPPYTRYLQGPAIDLRGLLPASGKLGFYVRARGWAGSMVAIVTHDLALGTFDTAYYLPVLNDFSEPIAYGPTDEGAVIDPDGPAPEPPYPAPYAWTRSEDAPTHVILALTPNAEFPSSGLVDIDCIIPFVEPLE